LHEIEIGDAGGAAERLGACPRRRHAESRHHQDEKRIVTVISLDDEVGANRHEFVRLIIRCSMGTEKPKADLLPGTLDMMVLKTDPGHLHGYAIAQLIQQLSDDLLRVEEGSLYPAVPTRKSIPANPHFRL
jgi:Transcriptional regulator PadR-like family